MNAIEQLTTAVREFTNGAELCGPPLDIQRHILASTAARIPD